MSRTRLPEDSPARYYSRAVMNTRKKLPRWHGMTDEQATLAKGWLAQQKRRYRQSRNRKDDVPSGPPEGVPSGPPEGAPPYLPRNSS